MSVSVQLFLSFMFSGTATGCNFLFFSLKTPPFRMLSWHLSLGSCPCLDQDGSDVTCGFLSEETVTFERQKNKKEWDRFYHSGHKLFCCLTERERWEGRKQIKLTKKHRSCPPFLDSISRFSVWLCFSRSVGVCVERVCVCLLHCAAVESPSLSQLLLLFGGHRILLAFFCFYFLTFFF